MTPTYIVLNENECAVAHLCNYPSDEEAYAAFLRLFDPGLFFLVKEVCIVDTSESSDYLDSYMESQE